MPEQLHCNVAFFFVCQKYSSFLVSTNINMRMKVPIYLLHKYRNGEKLIYASQKCMGFFTIETGGAAVCMRYLFFFANILLLALNIMCDFISREKCNWPVYIECMRLYNFFRFHLNEYVSNSVAPSSSLLLLLC